MRPSISSIVGAETATGGLWAMTLASAESFHGAERVGVEAEADLDRATAVGAGQREAVEEVRAGDEIHRLGEGAGDDLGGDRALAQRHGGGVAVEAVGQQVAALDLVHGDRRHAAPGV